ncbi:MULTISPECIES: hypothetical protein [unclassified Synechococcus]|uniref:hypothetical protein n=1 Tax=unclassified Synechococcus TaxID=2626047 RepID=UPI0026D45793
MAAAETSDQGLAAGPDQARSDNQAQNPEQPHAGTPESQAEHSLLVGPDELNAWRRGFTPQAEIWNGRLAMLGLSLGIAALLLIRLLTQP